MDAIGNAFACLRIYCSLQTSRSFQRLLLLLQPFFSRSLGGERLHQVEDDFAFVLFPDLGGIAWLAIGFDTFIDSSLGCSFQSRVFVAWDMRSIVFSEAIFWVLNSNRG